MRWQRHRSARNVVKDKSRLFQERNPPLHSVRYTWTDLAGLMGYQQRHYHRWHVSIITTNSITKYHRHHIAICSLSLITITNQSPHVINKGCSVFSNTPNSWHDSISQAPILLQSSIYCQFLYQLLWTSPPRSALFCNITQPIAVIHYRRFGPTCRCPLQGSRFLTATTRCVKVRPHRTRSAAADCGLCPLRNVTF